ncbi:relaxase/mobilization nuclease domain-containing protein [Streptomyces cellulosae]|uniref:relaxase/mobilization nuclease domain-containing protein n=1 Tax=Streptomyces TaxID=1883 RepID=UPI00225288C4|nr:relaxase/mobilization nuclease domain-containing protein [Streptomyces sp. OS603R]MCX4482146.1 relaxase/mobilization nuclease domain-containing protein [Streptomyces cellulosae]WTC54977.1 relaxase/mobilization nuclease domain-containing protein [Streptomyces cellulosae]
MIPRIQKRGQRTIGLLYYLYGPGKFEEHTDPHLVASWDHNAPDPGRNATATLKQLQQLLDQPVENIDPSQRPKKHVWHLSVRNGSEDRILSDQEWGDVARRMVAAAEIDNPEEGAGCRWAAVRHADDHIHIVATLVREDGYKPDLDNDANRVQAQARALEAELGLRRLNKGDGTAAKRPTSAERHKAMRQGRERTAREELRETVRRAVAGARSDEEFFDRLAAAGLLIRKRVAPSNDLLGYKVALPDDLNKDGEPVFYPGARLAPDLSLPRIRERWAGDAPDARREDAIRMGPGSPASARRGTASAVWQAMLVVEHGEDGDAAAHIAAAGEVLDALAKTSAAHTRRELHDAATAFERASRSHVRAVRGHDRALRQAARDLVQGGPALGRGEDGATTAMAIDMLFFLITAAAHWHTRKGHAQQAEAAARAAEHLRTAYRAASAQPLGVLYQRGRRLSRPMLQRQTVMLREALPELAEQILAEPGWYALAATIAEAEATGHDPAALLSDVAARRELGTADSVSDVLVWRMRRTADLPADASQLPETSIAEDRSATRGMTTGPSSPGRWRSREETSRHTR